MDATWRWWVDRFPSGGETSAHRDAAATSLRHAVRRAGEAARSGKRIDRFFHGALELASAGDCSLMFLCGEYVGEVSLDRAAVERCLPRGVCRVYLDFHPRHRFHFVSDPRRYAPGFPENLGGFPSRDAAATGLLQAMLDAGLLRRFERGWATDRGPLALVSFSSASLVNPWLRVEFEGHEFGWLLVDPSRLVRDGRWYFVAPPVLDGNRRRGFFLSRDEAARAMLAEHGRRYTEHPEHFDSDADHGIPGSGEWNRTAAALLGPLEPAVLADAPAGPASPRAA